MSKQLHKNFTNGQVKSLLKGYLDKKIKINYILQMLIELKEADSLNYQQNTQRSR